jgi:hypothetical protein
MKYEAAESPKTRNCKPSNPLKSNGMCAPFPNHPNKDSQKCNQKPTILSRQRNSSSLNVPMRPVRPEPQMHGIVL